MQTRIVGQIGLQIVLLGFTCLTAHGEQRPNILWLTAEDMSPTLGCYGDEYATTPHIDRLAEQSARYTHAFATAPVCSPSRSCLITGCYATSLGTQQMRSAFPLPEFMRGFPALLREQGYYTTNNVKTDYNTASEPAIVHSSWDDSSDAAHWRNRPTGRPFFSVFNFMTSHQSRTMQWPYEAFVRDVQSRLTPAEIHDPASAPVPPYYPDTPIIRRTIARYYDCVTAMDKEVGEVLRQLEEDGLADNTIVFFYSDHGSGMPRHKRALFDSGMHVPLLIRFPDKLQHFAPVKAGETTDRLVSFVDFGPTVLSLAGVPIPEYMQGNPFLGEAAAAPRERIFGHRDRIDEVFDTARSVRDHRYLYIRNFMPHRGYNPPSAWPDAGEINGEFYRLANRRTMTDAQWQFASPTRPIEELYDCQVDPLNLNNLAGSADHREVLARMRAAMHQHIQETRDLGFLPEIEQWKLSDGTTPWQAARRGGFDLEGSFNAAAQVGRAEETTFIANLTSEQAGVRYWGAICLAASDKLSADARRQLEAALVDSSPAVRIEAAGALAKHGAVDLALPVLTASLEQNDLTVMLHAARTIELLGDKARAAKPAMQEVAARIAARPLTRAGDDDLAMFIGFSTSAFLARVDAGG